ncbi:glycosyltransferase family 2 protein [Sphingomonas profundi]|uniref:glycosyltransferase family 2 protein n=1 Tax=Alterirhizorhabdus profundi TaxID=2681549 RepID=UPI001E50486F|nr:glycosyltransferase [Sphingomonas profundi]
MRIFVVVATLSRPETVRQTVLHLERQTRPPDGVLIAAVRAEDAPGIASDRFAVTLLLSEKGSCRQRNAGIEALRDRADVLLFLDDDFVADERYIAELEMLLERNPDIAGATGRIVADGIDGPGFSFEQARDMLARDVPPADQPPTWPTEAMYGCNMAVRLSATGDIRFDEDLPLYGWLEDIDFTYRVGRRGRLVGAAAMRGVHMGIKRGRTSGRRFGYSQIANPVHMLRKRTIPRALAWRMMRNNLLANVGRSLRPEPWVDRGGRLRGNLRALADLARGRLHPRRILELE